MMRHVRCENREISYLLEQKPVKNLNLRIHKDGRVFLSANPDVPASEIDAFILSKASYIFAAQDKFAEIARYSPQPKQYVSGETFYFLGRGLRLKVASAAKETVYTYGEYMRRFIHDVKKKGAYPVLMSLTPRNAWEDADSTIITRVNQTFGLWAKQVAKKARIPFIDLNDISARKFEKFGKEKVKYMFYLDRIHTSAFGARVNAESAAEGIRNYKGLELARYLKPVEKDTVTGATRKKGNPVLFTVGDSTVKNTDKDENGMWGWGSVIHELFDTERISVENHAKAGRSARTYLDEGRWDKIYHALQPGDFVLIQFGHNDAGDINTGKARAELPGSGNESKVFKMEKTGSYQVVYSFGWYLRKFIMDVKEKGAVPIVLSHTPRNKFDNGEIERNTNSFGKWTREAAEAAGAYFIDLNKISGDKLQDMGYNQGLRVVGTYFNHDHTHTSLKGARMNARSIADGLKATDCPLKDFLK